MAQIILMVCILSIVLTAPFGAIMTSITGPRLLTKTKPLNPNGEIWHFTTLETFRKKTNTEIIFSDFLRSHRPSLYDITVTDQNETRKDQELQNNIQTTENTNARI